MFYLTSNFHDDGVNTFGFMERGLLKPPPLPKAQELRKTPGGIGLTHLNGALRTFTRETKLQGVYKVYLPFLSLFPI